MALHRFIPLFFTFFLLNFCDIQAQGYPQLSATLMESLNPGEEARAAVAWAGELPAKVRIWVDINEDGFWSKGETLAGNVELQKTITIVTGQIPKSAPEGMSSDRVKVELLEQSQRTAGGSCKGWLSGFQVADLDDYASASVVWDDGGGAALYVAGGFIMAGGLEVNRIARWDGSSWSALPGPTGTGMNGAVHALAVFDDGGGNALYAAGSFTSSGGMEVNNIAKWDGTAWSSLAGPSGIGTTNTVYSLAVFNDGGGDALYAGGSFTSAGGLEVNNIAKWDGGSWSALAGPSGTGTDPIVFGLGVFDDGSGDALFVVGLFNRAGGLSVRNIAKWDGTTWSALVGGGIGSVFYGLAYSLAVFDDGSGDALYVGGQFLSAGDGSARNIAKWDGGSWSDVGGGVTEPHQGWVSSMTVFNDGSGDALYAGGFFNTAGEVKVKNIAKWDGETWSPLGGVEEPRRGGVASLTVFNDGNGDALYAGGSFTLAKGVPVNNIVKWSGTAWLPLSEPSGSGLSGSIHGLTVFDDGSGHALFAAGQFFNAGGAIANFVAKWEGTAWSVLSGPAGTGMNGPVIALAVYDDGGGSALYAGGSFSSAGGLVVNNIAKWDGSSWSALSGPDGAGTDWTVSALAVFDDGGGEALYTAGRFSTAGGVAVGKVAKWDGITWSALTGPSGTGVSVRANALEVFDDGNGEALYIGGLFASAGGVWVNNIAKWDGANWSALSGPTDTGTSDGVFALEVFDDGNGEALYAGGSFNSAGGATANHIAKWDGTGWSPLTGLSGNGTLGYVRTMAVYDDGGGEALFVGGSFDKAGEITVNHITKWDGATWTTLTGPAGLGTNQPVYALEVGNDGGSEALFVGGDFDTAGGIASSNIAKWTCKAPLFASGFETGDTSEWSTTLP